MKFTNQWNYVSETRFHETTTPDTQTIPDDAYSISELLKKYAAGIPINDQLRENKYIPEAAYDTLSPLLKPDRDLTDIDDLKASIALQKAEIENKKEKATRLKAEAEAKRRNEAPTKPINEENESFPVVPGTTSTPT